MYLTKEEEHIYNGEHGWANQVCMKILVRLGELFDATKLVPINSAHVSGVSYKTLGDAPQEFLESLANAGARTRVSATLNPQSFDPEYLEKKLSTSLKEKQLNILRQFEKMGFAESLTCTPYYLNKPERGSHIAWAESSAVVYANSILNSWTNREGGPSALAAAIIGKTPNYGVHKPENRCPRIRVRVNTQLHDETGFGALGIFLGKKLEDNTPIICGLRETSESCLKQLGAALASTGMVNMFHLQEPLPKTQRKLRTINVETEDVKNTINDLSTASKPPDLVFIGCPHCSPSEIRKIAQLVKGKKVKKNTEFWVCTSRHVKKITKRYAEEIERSGGHVLTDVCTVVSWTETLGIRTIMTNSAKTAHYAPTLCTAETTLSPLIKCIEAAFEG